MMDNMRQILGNQFPNLLIMVGPSGAGKSTIAAKTGLPIVSTDVIRKNLFGIKVGINGAKISEEAYTFAGFRDTFNAAKFIVDGYLRGGQSVVYDATNLSKTDRIGFLKYFYLEPEFSDDLRIRANVYYWIVDRPLEEKLDYFNVANLLGYKPFIHTNEDIIRRHHDKMKATLPDALNGDGLGFVTVRDLRNVSGN
jgi:hypothetical protein